MALAQLPRHKGPMNTGLHWACWAPSKCPQPAHGWRQCTLQLKLLHMNFVKSLLELKIICLRAREKNPFSFTSCGIMNSPFQGMCEFLLGLSECCKIFAVNVCPSFQTNGFLCTWSLLLPAFLSSVGTGSTWAEAVGDNLEAAIGWGWACSSSPFLSVKLVFTRGTSSFSELSRMPGRWNMSCKELWTKQCPCRALGIDLHTAIYNWAWVYCTEASWSIWDTYMGLPDLILNLWDPYPLWVTVGSGGPLRTSQTMLNSYFWLAYYSCCLKAGWNHGHSKSPAREDKQKRDGHYSNQANTKEAQRQEILAFIHKHSLERWGCLVRHCFTQCL